jgi:5-methyltetrahydrofolate--homocysteine methyltransferase
MTTTLPAMQATVEALKGARDVPVFVGGAVVTKEWADSVGAGYAEDAPGCVEAVRAAISR